MDRTPQIAFDLKTGKKTMSDFDVIYKRTESFEKWDKNHGVDMRPVGPLKSYSELESEKLNIRGYNINKLKSILNEVYEAGISEGIHHALQMDRDANYMAVQSAVLQMSLKGGTK